MSRYLTAENTDFLPAGMDLPSPATVIRASALIDAECRREIGLKTYTERVPLTTGYGHLTYKPIREIVAVRGRAAYGLTGDNTFGVPELAEIPLTSLDVNRETGSFSCVGSAFGIPYTELEVEYVSGYDPIPDNVKVVCGMLIEKMAAGYDQNVKLKKDFDFTIEYFGNSLLTAEMCDLLAPYKVISFR